MPLGKPAGVRCVQLTADNRCQLFGKPERPAVCGHLQPGLDMCGVSNEEAILLLAQLEQATTFTARASRLNSGHDHNFQTISVTK